MAKTSQGLYVAECCHRIHAEKPPIGGSEQLDVLVKYRAHNSHLIILYKPSELAFRWAEVNFSSCQYASDILLPAVVGELSILP